MRELPEFLKVKPKVPAKVVITGIIALVILEIFAMYNGINGRMYAVVVGVIALAIGVIIPTPKLK